MTTTLRTIELTIPTTPVAKGRPKASAVGGFVKVYTPKKTRHYEAEVAHHAAKALGDDRITSPIMLELTFYLPRPGRLMRKKDPDESVPHTTRPDLDNLVKSTLDGMEPWFDDKQVYHTKASKYYHRKGGVPCTKVRLRFWEQ